MPSVPLCGRTLWQRAERNLDLSLFFFRWSPIGCSPSEAPHGRRDPRNWKGYLKLSPHLPDRPLSCLEWGGKDPFPPNRPPDHRLRQQVVDEVTRVEEIDRRDFDRP